MVAANETAKTQQNIFIITSFDFKNLPLKTKLTIFENL
jgi:hypothetical protein